MKDDLFYKIVYLDSEGHFTIYGYLNIDKIEDPLDDVWIYQVHAVYILLSFQEDNVIICKKIPLNIFESSNEFGYSYEEIQRVVIRKLFGVKNEKRTDSKSIY